MASQFGFNMGSTSNGTFSQTNIQEANSRRVVEEALLKKGVIDGKEDLLINHHITFNELREDWIELISRIYTLVQIEEISLCSMIVLLD